MFYNVSILSHSRHRVPSIYVEPTTVQPTSNRFLIRSCASKFSLAPVLVPSDTVPPYLAAQLAANPHEGRQHRHYTNTMLCGWRPFWQHCSTMSRPITNRPSHQTYHLSLDCHQPWTPSLCFIVLSCQQTGCPYINTLSCRPFAQNTSSHHHLNCTRWGNALNS